MSVSTDDVRHIAGLARIALDPDRVETLVGELNRILEHMEVLAAVPTRPEQRVSGVSAGGMPLREDRGPQLPLARSIDQFAPQVRDGFLLVPRLATHEDPTEGAS